MYLVKYEEYYNDYSRRFYEKEFVSLDAVANWMFGMMKRDPAENMYIPVPNNGLPSKGIGRIEMRPVYGMGTIWIHMISSGRGIEFTDGQFTSGQKHWSQSVQEWLISCRERQLKPVYTFAE